jgi:hypothetical protein
LWESDAIDLLGDVFRVPFTPECSFCMYLISRACVSPVYSGPLRCGLLTIPSRMLLQLHDDHFCVVKNFVLLLPARVYTLPGGPKLKKQHTRPRNAYGLVSCAVTTTGKLFMWGMFLPPGFDNTYFDDHDNPIKFSVRPRIVSTEDDFVIAVSPRVDRI